MPLGAPVFLTLDRPEASGLWVAQDTGGAIKGANRFDTFWGAGEAAEQTAGGMSAKGQALILLPKGVVGACAACPLKKRRFGQRSPQPSGRFRATRSMRPSPPRRQLQRSHSKAARAGFRRQARHESLRSAPKPFSRRRWTAAGTGGCAPAGWSRTAMLDLHGHSLDRAWQAIDRTLERSIAVGRPGSAPDHRA